MALGAGLRFAVPEIINIRSADYSNAVGNIAFGPKGERYVAVINSDTVSRPQGNFAFYRTATATTDVSSNVSQWTNFLVGTADSATNQWAGIWASSVAGTQLQFLQVNGTTTVVFSGAFSDSASASASSAVILVPGNSASQVTSAATANISLNAYACQGLLWPQPTVATSTGFMVLRGGRL